MLEQDSEKTLVVINLPGHASDIFYGNTIFSDGELLYLCEILNRYSFHSKYIMICNSEAVGLYHPENHIREIVITNPVDREKMIKRKVVSNECSVFDY